MFICLAAQTDFVFSAMQCLKREMSFFSLPVEDQLSLSEEASRNIILLGDSFIFVKDSRQGRLVHPYNTKKGV